MYDSRSSGNSTTTITSLLCLKEEIDIFTNFKFAKHDINTFPSFPELVKQEFLKLKQKIVELEGRIEELEKG